MLDGVKARALGEHPAGKDAFDLARQLGLVDLDEGGRMRRLGRRRGIADPWRHLQGAELDGLVDGNFKMRDAPGHLVEGGEHGDRVLDGVGAGRRRSERAESRDGKNKDAGGGSPPGNCLTSLHHSAHLVTATISPRPVRSCLQASRGSRNSPSRPIMPSWTAVVHH